jgi:hypothetical protein
VYSYLGIAGTAIIGFIVSFVYFKRVDIQ